MQSPTSASSTTRRRHRHALYTAAVVAALLVGGTDAFVGGMPTSTSGRTGSASGSEKPPPPPQSPTPPLVLWRDPKARPAVAPSPPTTALEMLLLSSACAATATAAAAYASSSSEHDVWYYMGRGEGRTADTGSDPFDPEFRPSSVGTIVVDPLDPDFRPSTRTAGILEPEEEFTHDFDLPTLRTTTVVDTKQPNFQLYCDLDGVLVDFEAGVQKICGQATAELAKTEMWHSIERAGESFFDNLPWTRDGPQLWQAIRHLRPDILTGVPDLAGSRQEKVDWCRRHLLDGQEDDYRHVDMAGFGYNHANVNGQTKRHESSHITHIITCWSYNKHYESGPNAVLIDDRIALKASWEAKGGIFVHHTDTESTLKQLRAIGVLQDKDNDDDQPPVLNSRNRKANRGKSQRDRVMP